jgi:hypothetical protein
MGGKVSGWRGCPDGQNMGSPGQDGTCVHGVHLRVAQSQMPCPKMLAISTAASATSPMAKPVS